MTKPLEPLAKIAGCIVCESPALIDRLPGIDPLLAFFALGCGATLVDAGVVLCRQRHAQIHQAMRALGFDRKSEKIETKAGAPS